MAAASGPRRLSARVEGRCISFLDAGGAGPPVVFVHGLAGSAADFSLVIDRVARAGYRALAVDLPGTGLSERPAGRDVSIAAQARRLGTALREAGLARPLLVGSSLGGGIGVRLALDASGALRGLLLLDALVFAKPLPWYFPLVAAPLLPEAVVCAMPAARVARWVVRTATHPAFVAEDSLVRDLASAHRGFSNRLALLATVRALRREEKDGLARRLPELELPVRVVWGEADPAIPLAFGRRLAEAIRGAELRVIERCGHLPQIEAPKRLADEVIAFARAVGPSGGAPPHAPFMLPS